MKRPGVVWVYSILVALGILYWMFQSIKVFTAPLGIHSPTSVFVHVLLLLLIIPEAIFIAKFFMLKRSSLTWLYISFGLAFLLNLVLMSWVFAIVIALFGWAVWDYIMHKKIDGQNIFV